MPMLALHNSEHENKDVSMQSQLSSFTLLKIISPIETLLSDPKNAAKFQSTSDKPSETKPFVSTVLNMAQSTLNYFMSSDTEEKEKPAEQVSLTYEVIAKRLLENTDFKPGAHLVGFYPGACTVRVTTELSEGLLKALSDEAVNQISDCPDLSVSMSRKTR